MPDKKTSPFALLRTVEIPEIKVVLTELVHEKTGAKVMHLAADDEENFFNLSLQTLPETSNGVAHVLEHTVLCGSQKFPVRDPFFAMGRRSLNTFMNAFTGADFTCYPAASQVEHDFYNLLAVYLDAVFHPLLKRLSFLQEGHRLTFSEEGEAKIQGVVYNEMKGALSSAESRLSEALMAALFPDLTYGINSGGDPKEIPALTYEALLAFHQKFYHPGRCLFFFYGNLPLERHLQFLEENLLATTSPLAPLPPLQRQKRFTKKVEQRLSYPVAQGEEGEERAYVAFGWLTVSILEQKELLALQVIDLVLMGTDAAPLKLALLKSTLCKQVDSSLEEEISEIPYCLICKGCKEQAAPKLEKVIFDTLNTILENPLPEKLVEGAIHQLEMSRKEITVPYGLSLYFRSALLKQHGALPEEGLKIHTLFKELRERVKDPHYLPSLLRKHIVDNPHFVAITLLADPALQKKEQEEEEKLTKQMSNKLSAKEKKSIEEENEELEAIQENTEPVDVLPKIVLKDVPKGGKEFALQQETLQNWTLYSHPCFTNEVLYVDLVLPLPALTPEDIPFLRLFALFLPQVGCGGRDYKAHLDFVFEHTGGLGAELDFGCFADAPYRAWPSLVIRGKTLYHKSDKLFSLFRALLVSANFRESERISELLLQHHQEMEHSLQTSPLRYAMQLAASSFSTPLYVRNALYGLPYYQSLCAIVKKAAKNPSFLSDKLEELKNKCLAFQGGDVILGCDGATVERVKREQLYGLETLPLHPFTPWKGEEKPKKETSQGRIIASPVAFTTLAFPTFSYLDPRSAPLSIASKIMENKVLHKRIREQGGAYGSGAAHLPMSGYFYFYSYRDPHLAATREAFSEAATELARGAFDASDLEEAILGIVQELDAPLSPGHRAYVAYERLRFGRTPERRQEYRNRLMKSSHEEISRLGAEILLPGLDRGVLVSFGNEEILHELNFPIYQVS